MTWTVSNTFFCQAPWHEPNQPSSPGYSRRVPHSHDMAIVSLDFTGRQTEQRWHRISLTRAKTWEGLPIGPPRLCRDCMNAWLGRIDPGMDQGTLL